MICYLQVAAGFFGYLNANYYVKGQLLPSNYTFSWRRFRTKLSEMLRNARWLCKQNLQMKSGIFTRKFAYCN